MTARRRSKNERPDEAAPGTATPRAESDRESILDLLDGARARQKALDPKGDPDAFVYFSHLSAVAQLTDLFFHDVLKSHRISLSEHRVIGALRSRGREFRATPKALNRSTQITSAGMTSTLDRLEAAGYVSRTTNPADRRSVLVGLTDAGWAFSETLSRDLGARFAQATASAKRPALRKEIEALRSAVERLAEALFGS